MKHEQTRMSRARIYMPVIALSLLAAAATVSCGAAQPPTTRVDNTNRATTRPEVSSTTATAPLREPVWVRVEYRPDPLDIAYPGRFDLMVPQSTLVDMAAYDPANQYLLIALHGRWYHFCRVPQDVWNSFETADSKGRFLNIEIRGRYDCRSGGIPSYTP